MITSQQRLLLLQLMQSPQWAVIEQMKNELCDKIMYDSTIKDSEWETLKETLMKEGQVAGINRFINELYTEAQHAHEQT